MRTRSYHGRPSKKLRAKRVKDVPPQPLQLAESSQMSPQDPENNLDVEEPQNNFTVEDPLSYYPVLKVIFGFLNDEDLENCCLVSRYWRDVAAPMFSPRYEVEFRSDIGSPWCPPRAFMIIEMGRYNRKCVKEYTLDFKRVNQTLEECVRTNRLAISLKVYCQSIDIKNEAGIKFLEKYGPYVKKLTLIREGKFGMSLNEFCIFLLVSVPNLVSLHCSCLQFVEDSAEDPVFDPDLPNNKHKQLRKICFKPLSHFIPQPFGNGKLRKILRMASNLEGIHDLPLWLIKEVEEAEKVPALKSVSCRHDCSLLFSQNGLTVLSAFDKLALLQPQLTSWSFVPSKYRLEEGTFMEMIKPFIFSTLQSSAESLQSFEIGSTQWYGYQNLPQLKGLKTLVLSESISKSKYFSPENSLLEIFSNVSEIRISFYLDDENINRYLPEDMISPWGTQIKRLYVKSLPSSSIPLLHRRFPQIQHLEFSGSEKVIGEALPILVTLWPKLKTLALLVHGIDYEYGFCGLWGWTLDSALTGLPKEIVDQLQDEPTRENFSEAQIDAFKNQSTICRWSELKQLRIELNMSRSWKSTDVFTSLTQVTDEFGFKLIPDLKVTVGIRTCGREREVIKTRSLEPWAHLESDKVKVVDLYRSSGQW